MSELRIALIAGATGLLGRHLLARLLTSPQYEYVIALTRGPFPLRHPRLYVRQVDFTQLNRDRDAITGNDFFCCLGPRPKDLADGEALTEAAYNRPWKVAYLAHAGGAEQCLLVSCAGAATDAPSEHMRIKRDLETAIAGIGFPSLHVFRPGAMTGEPGDEARMLPGKAKLARMVPGRLAGGLARHRPIAAATVADAMLQRAQRRHVGVRVYEHAFLRSFANR